MNSLLSPTNELATNYKIYIIANVRLICTIEIIKIKAHLINNGTREIGNTMTILSAKRPSVAH